MTQWCYPFPVSCDLFGHSIHWRIIWGLSIQVLTSYDLFWAFDSSAFPDKSIRISSWLKQYLGDLNRLNSWLKQLSRNCLRINSWLKWIPRYWFRSTHDSECFPIFDSNQLMTQAKNIWFWADSWFDSEPYPCLSKTVSRVRLQPLVSESCVCVCVCVGGTFPSRFPRALDSTFSVSGVVRW